MTFNGRPAFYLHTINGPWINSAQVKEVIDALYRQRALLGAETLVLPTVERAHANINFMPIFSVFADRIRKSSARGAAITYLDSPVRAILHRAAQGNYDLEHYNSRGFEYLPETNPDEGSTVTATMDPPDVITPLAEGEAASTAELLLLAHGLAQGRRWETARWVLQSYGIGAKEWNEYRTAAAAARAGTEEPTAALREALVRWGMPEDQVDAAMKRYSSYFQATAPDFFPAPPPPPPPSRPAPLPSWRAPPTLSRQGAVSPQSGPFRLGAEHSAALSQAPAAPRIQAPSADEAPGDRLWISVHGLNWGEREAAKQWLITNGVLGDEKAAIRLIDMASFNPGPERGAAREILSQIEFPATPGVLEKLEGVVDRMQSWRESPSDIAFFKKLEKRVDQALKYGGSDPNGCSARLKKKSFIRSLFGR